MTDEIQAAPTLPHSTYKSQSLLTFVKDSLSNSAAAYSSRGKIRLHVLFSTPRIAKDLYPFAHIDAKDAAKTTKENPVEAFVEHVIMTASWEEGEDSEERHHQIKQGRMMYALECFLYTLPGQRSSLLYVSKLDSSGWGPSSIPRHLQAYLTHRQEDSSWDSSTSITRMITRAFLSYFASLSHWSDTNLPAIRHISIHILARSQGAYLFPSSNDNKGKHVLSDGALIKWWRSLMSSVVCGVKRREKNAFRIEARPYYLIPGYDRLESHELLPLPPSSSTHSSANEKLHAGDQVLAEAGWVYGHPYSYKGANLDRETSSLPPLPLSGPSFSTTNNPAFDPEQIAMLLPHFPDDPKSRFIAELARDSYEHAAITKRKALPSSDGEEEEDGKKKARIEDSAEEKTSSDAASKESTFVVSSIINKAMKERGALNKVSADEFWTRMGFRQECCAGNAVGVFVTLFTRYDEQEAGWINEPSKEGELEKVLMRSQAFALPHPTLPDLVRKHLMKDACDWSKAEGSRDLTRAWDDGVERAIKRKGGASQVEEKVELGRDVVYADVILCGPTKEELVTAQQRYKESQEKLEDEVGTATVPSTTVNTLSVKRKKKV
ncbi:hypothetical protein CBS101457_001241 [Exobasidium rhododendri]|nr:hypothetical protein CBS101457_001241 [Exobasidium rhododendri]